MENQDREQLLIQKRDKLRQDIQDRGEMKLPDLIKLINLDRSIAQAKSARKHPRWTKFKNWCFSSPKLSNKNRLDKMKAIAKSVLKSAVLSPITVPLSAYSSTKDTLARTGSLIRNTFRYDPSVAKTKNPILKALKTGVKSLMNQNAANSMFSGLQISRSINSMRSPTNHQVVPDFIPDDKTAVLARIQGRKSANVVKEETVSKQKAFKEISPDVLAQIQISAVLNHQK